ncbi:MAG: HAD family phosphatase [Bdellovibrionia bacterium]
MIRNAQNDPLVLSPAQSETKAPVEIQAIIFDLDGTIIDTEPTAVLAVKECFAEWNIPIHFDDATYLTGRTWENAFAFLFNKYKLPVPLLEAKQKLLGRYRQKIEENLTAVPGSVQAIQSLAEKYPLALVSGSGRSEILWALTKLKVIDHFQIILGAEDYPRSKPQPDGYLKAMGILGKAPGSCLVFEDSTAGIASARAAGTWVVAVTSTNHFKQDLELAHVRITDLTLVNANWISGLAFS